MKKILISIITVICVNYVYGQNSTSIQKKKIALEKEIYETKEAYDSTPDDSPEEKKLLAKLSKDVVVYINLTTSLSEVRDMSYFAPDSLSRSICDQRVDALIREKIPTIKSADSASYFYDMSNSELLGDTLLKKWNLFLKNDFQLLRTSQSISEWYDENESYFSKAHDSVFEKEVSNKWILDFEKKFLLLKNFNQVDSLLHSDSWNQSLFYLTDNSVKVRLVDKELSLVKTEPEARRLYGYVRNNWGNYYDIQKIYNVWKQFYPKVEDVKTEYKALCSEIKMNNFWLLAVTDEFGESLDNSTYETLLLLRWIELTDSYEDLMTIWKKSEDDSIVQKNALEKLSTFVRKKQ